MVGILDFSIIYSIYVTVALSSKALGQTSIALNFSHPLNPNLVVFLITQKAARELKVLLFGCSMFV